MHRPILALSLALVLLPAAGQAQIRNAPSPRALEFAAYIFSAANVCGYRIGVDEFGALLEKQNVKASDVGPRGPHGAKVQTMFALMSNQMALNRERSCLAVAGEYGPEGSVAKGVLLPAPAAEAPAGAKPAENPPQ
jgi:hypothetical protein